MGSKPSRQGELSCLHSSAGHEEPNPKFEIPQSENPTLTVVKVLTPTHEPLTPRCSTPRDLPVKSLTLLLFCIDPGMARRLLKVRPMKLSPNHGDRIALVPTRKDEAREAMVLSHFPLVRQVAERVRRRLPPGIDLESLVHSGVVGLLEAFDRYDPERGVSFQAYARHRIHGEIIQCLRSLDWASRSVRAWSRKLATARNELAVTYCREATADEVAEELGVSLAAYHRLHGKVNEGRPVRFDDPSASLEEQQGKQHETHDRFPHEDPFRSVERQDLKEKLREAITLLPERERRVVELHHWKEMTLRSISQLLGLTEGRICQIYNKACKSLRRTLEGDAD